MTTASISGRPGLRPVFTAPIRPCCCPPQP